MIKLRSILVLAAVYLLPLVTWAKTSVGNQDSTSVGNRLLPNPLRDGVDSLYDFLALILNSVVLPVGSVIVVIFIIYTGFKFVTARGNEEKILEARHSFFWVVIGTAILLGAAAISGAIQGTVCQIAPDLPICQDGNSFNQIQTSGNCPPGSYAVPQDDGSLICE